MSYSLREAVLDAITVAVPPVRLDAIRTRERTIDARSRNRRSAIALAALLLSFAGLAVAPAERPVSGSVRAPAPIASLHPLPTVT